MTNPNFRINDSDFSLKPGVSTMIRRKYRKTRNYHNTRAARGLAHWTRDEIKRSYQEHLLASPFLRN